jgi:hypothetical protein
MISGLDRELGTPIEVEPGVNPEVIDKHYIAFIGQRTLGDYERLLDQDVEIKYVI